MAAAGILAAAIVFVFVTLPAKPVKLPLDHLDPDLRARTVSGAYHIHTTRSDGAEDKPAVAAGAARAGLQFAIFTEHGDGTSKPDPPTYIHGVLCIDGVEISTNGGHYVALALGPTPYPLGGEASAVVEDVARLGGFGIAAHPDHPKSDLAWSDWKAPIDGVEWLNADSEWRDETSLALARLVFAYPMRPGPALASVFDRPSTTLDRWDALSKERRVVALAAADAHGGARTRRAEEGETRAAIGPSYDASFQSMSNRVVLDRPFSKNAAQDAALLLDAIRRGRVYTVVDAISPDVAVNIGSEAMSWTSSPLMTASPEPFHDGPRHRLEVIAERSPGTPQIPWILTNWIGPPPVLPVPPVPPLGESVPLSLSSSWRVEHDPDSSGRVSGAESLVTLEYRLAAGERRSQFAAAAADIEGQAPFEALAFRGRADRPMRVSVQLRFRPDDRRWVRSVYLDSQEQDVRIQLGDMQAAEQRGAPIPLLSSVRSLLFLVDLVNAAPGAAGSFTISDLRVSAKAGLPRRSASVERGLVSPTRVSAKAGRSLSTPR